MYKICENIYWERQVGGNCRIHSLNSFFGFNKYSEITFNKHCNDYDNINKYLYNTNISCKNFDLVNSNQQNIISYILKKNNIYTKYCPINYVYSFIKNDIQDYINKNLNRLFMYNEGHIWAIKKYNNTWYEIDSLRGVIKINTDIISFIKNFKNVGFIIPISATFYFYKNLKILNNIIFKNSKYEMQKHEMQKHIKNYIISANKEKKIIGEIEVYIDICIDILNFIFVRNTINTHTNNFIPIKNLIENYNIFLSKFTDGNYSNVDLILLHLPNIIYSLVKLEIR